MGHAYQPPKIAFFPNTGFFRSKLSMREIARVSMDVIVEQVAVSFGDSGVEWILRPRNRA